MSSIWILGGAALVFLVAYLTFGSYLAGKWGVVPKKKTPAQTQEDGFDYTPSKTPVVLGHHLASIVGPGTIGGPVMAAFFGWVPVLLWVLAGNIFIGALQGFGTIFASVRCKGRSIITVMRNTMGRRAEICFAFMAWLTLVAVIAVFGDMAVEMFSGLTLNSQGAQVLNMTNGAVAMAAMLMIPAAVFLGFLNRMNCPVFITAIIAILFLGGCVGAGLFFPMYFPANVWRLVILGYVLVASLLPVWVLVQPRDYLNSFLIYGIILAGAAGLFLAGSKMELVAFAGWKADGRLLFPVLFVTVLGGAISGVHSLVGSGITSKQINNERNIRGVGFGSAMITGMVAVLALVVVGSVSKDGDFSQYGTPLQAFAAALGRLVMAMGLDSKWEQAVAIVLQMVMAALIFNTLDTIARTARILLQEVFIAERKKNRLLGNPVAATLITLAAASLVGFAGYDHIWSLMGSMSMLLAVPALITLAAWLKQNGKKMWIVLPPMGFMLAVSGASLAMTFWQNLQELLARDGSWESEGLQNVIIGATAVLLVIIIIDGVRGMRKKQEIIFATGNEGKMKEIREILSDLDVEVFSLKDKKIDVEIEEDGETFRDNAILKAKEICRLTGQLTLADDSGLEIDYLDKEPGVHSARYMGEDTSYTIKNASLLKRLEGVPKEQRTARFVCVIAAAYPDGQVKTTTGIMEGYIGYEEKGENGFGYDPIFFLDEFGCSSAELDMEQKNKVSHRGKALRAMKRELL